MLLVQNCWSILKDNRPLCHCWIGDVRCGTTTAGQQPSDENRDEEGAAEWTTARIPPEHIRSTRENGSASKWQGKWVRVERNEWIVICCCCCCKMHGQPHSVTATGLSVGLSHSATTTSAAHNYEKTQRRERDNSVIIESDEENECDPKIVSIAFAQCQKCKGF